MEGTGGNRRAWLRCPWAAGPGRASRRRTQPHISDTAPPVWRVPEGPEGTGGLRGAATNEVRPPSLAGGRAIRRPEHQRGNKQQVGEPDCGARGRRRDRPDNTQRQAAPMWRAPRGLQGLAGQQHRHPDRLEAAARRPEICRGHKQKAERPPPTGTPSSPARRTAHATPATPVGPQHHTAARQPNTPRRHNKTARPHRGRAAQPISVTHRRITTMSGSPRPLSWRTLEMPSLAATSFAVPSMRRSS